MNLYKEIPKEAKIQDYLFWNLMVSYLSGLDHFQWLLHEKRVKNGCFVFSFCNFLYAYHIRSNLSRVNNSSCLNMLHPLNLHDTSWILIICFMIIIFFTLSSNYLNCFIELNKIFRSCSTRDKGHVSHFVNSSILDVMSYLSSDTKVNWG